MNKEIKYTTDGKKVVVIGTLNSTESIVQEIFIVDGSEIPTGEHFVTKSLLDAPAISWKEQRLKELEEKYEKDEKHYKNMIDSLTKEYNEQRIKLKAKLDYIGLALKNANPDSFNTLVDFITGEIKWIVDINYNMEIYSIDEFHKICDGRLRLISLFGQDDGTFTYYMGRYSDYSGSRSKFIPCKGYDEAVQELKKHVLEKGVSDHNIKISKKYGFSFPDDDLNNWKEKRINEFNESIKKNQEERNRLESCVSELINLKG